MLLWELLSSIFLASVDYQEVYLRCGPFLACIVYRYERYNQVVGV